MIHNNMQADNRQLLRQQLILKALGYYNYHLNGIWGTHSVEAMRKFEKSEDFVPGRPSGGLPFANKGPYPKGIYKQGQLLNAEFLTDQHFKMEEDAIKGKKGKSSEKQENKEVAVEQPADVDAE